MTRHTIRRQCVELCAASGSDGRRLQSDLESWLEGTLTGVLDRVFTRMVSSELVIQLDRVECELGGVSEAELRTAFPERLEQELSRVLGPRISALQRHLTQAGTGTPSCARARAGPLPPPAELGPAIETGGPESTAPARAARALTTRAARVELLRRFLDVGSLPWWASRELAFDPDALIDDLRDEPADLARATQGLGERALSRLMKQCSASSRRVLLAALAGVCEHESLDLEQDLAEWRVLLLSHGGVLVRASGATLGQWLEEEALRFFLSPQSGRRLPSELAGSLLRAVAGYSGVAQDSLGRALCERARVLLPSSSAVRTGLEAQVSSLGVHAAAATAPAMPAAGALASADAAAGGARRRTGPSSGPAAAGGPTRRAAPSPDGVARARLGRETAQRGGTESAAASGAALSRERPSEPEPGVALDDEGLYLENAGLVLVWPYLPQYFRALGLVQGSSFASAAAQERAVLLLQHLGTGQDSCVEHELALNKLLVGFPLEAPVDRQLSLSPREIHESEELLCSVVDHWKVLKRTSVPALRSAFLQRQGHLAAVDGSFKLRVARKSYDLVLDALPWGIGIIALSWMERTLWVEW